MLSPRFEGTPFPMLPPEAQSLYAYNTYTLIIYNIFTHILSFYMKIHLQDHSLQQAFQSRQCFAQNTENREKIWNLILIRLKSNCIKVKITKYLVNRNDWLEKFAKDEVSLRQVFENLEKYKDNSFENICNVLKISLFKTLICFEKKSFENLDNVLKITCTPTSYVRSEVRSWKRDYQQAEIYTMSWNFQEMCITHENLTYQNSSRILRIIGGPRRPNLLQVDKKVLRFYINCQPDYFRIKHCQPGCYRPNCNLFRIQDYSFGRWRDHNLERFPASSVKYITTEKCFKINITSMFWELPSIHQYIVNAICQSV